MIGYTTGVFDLFHVGHVNILRNAKGLCDKLIVGVTTDDLVPYKGKQSVIPFIERIDIVRSIRYVDLAVPQDNHDKIEAHKRYGFDILFVGDDWYGNSKWERYKEYFHEIGVKVVFMPYTTSTSSTLINDTLLNLRG